MHNTLLPTTAIPRRICDEAMDDEPCILVFYGVVCPTQLWIDFCTAFKNLFMIRYYTTERVKKPSSVSRE